MSAKGLLGRREDLSRAGMITVKDMKASLGIEFASAIALVLCFVVREFAGSIAKHDGNVVTNFIS